MLKQWLGFPAIIARGKVGDSPKEVWYKNWMKFKCRSKAIKGVEFSSDILTHLLFVWFINTFHRGIVIWFFCRPKHLKGDTSVVKQFFSSKAIILLTLRGPRHSEAKLVWYRNMKFDRGHTWPCTCQWKFSSLVLVAHHINSFEWFKEWLCGKEQPCTLHVSDSRIR